MKTADLCRNSFRFNLAASGTDAFQAARSKNYQFVGLDVFSPHVTVCEILMTKIAENPFVVEWAVFGNGRTVDLLKS
jgi:hypothetical protein